MTSPRKLNVSDLSDEESVHLIYDAISRLTQKTAGYEWLMSWQDFMCVIPALQLAIRHPLYPRYSRDRIRLWLDLVIKQIAFEEPILSAILRRGDDPSQDRVSFPSTDSEADAPVSGRPVPWLNDGEDEL